MAELTKVLLPDDRVPTAWLNVAPQIGAEFPKPVIGEEQRPATLDDLTRLSSVECARIELVEGIYGRQPEIDIPGEVMDRYRSYRSTPLFRACGLERMLDYKGKIFFKREDVNPTGSHKPNTAIPQTYYAWNEGANHVVTDTGAGQWGASLALACQSFGMQCTIFMTRNSYTDKPYRRYLMELAGAAVHPSPSGITRRGRSLLAEDPEHRGSLGIGMGEAVEFVGQTPGAKLALGCMSYYAALHQTVVGLEARAQLELFDVEPDVLIACVGGGTNLFGFMAPWLSDAWEGRAAPEMIAAESANVPVLSKGEYRYDYADYFGLTPKILMYTLGHDFVPPKMHSGGLRYHGKSPVLSLMVRKGFVKPAAVSQEDAFDAGRLFLRAEGIVAAPESCHAIAETIHAVHRAQEDGRARTIVFCLSGTGYLDLLGYAKAFGLQR